MTLYINAFNDVCSPLFRGYNSGIWGVALNSAYNLWWINARRRDWNREPEKIFYGFQTALTSILNPLICDAFTSTVLNIVKLENINDAYTRRRESYNMINRAWRGEFTSKDAFFPKKWVLTATKMFLYLKESLFFFMTCVDAAKSLEFCPQARLEALTNVINNTVRVGQLLLRPEEAIHLKEKLRNNITLIETSFQMNYDEALVLIEKIYLALTAIQDHGTVTTAKKIAEGAKAASNIAGFFTDKAEKASDSLFNFITSDPVSKKKKMPPQKKSQFCDF